MTGDELPPDRPLTDEERYPLLSEAGRQTLKGLREHPHAPRYNHVCGDRLDSARLAEVRRFAELQRSTVRGWRPGQIPPWVLEHAASCLETVPIYRRCGPWTGDFLALPTTSRADLAREPWSFVPDGASLADLILYDTSGTTGHRIQVISHPVTSSMYLPLLEAALATRGVELETGPERVALIQLCAQRTTYVFANISTYLDEAGFAKINLDPGDWHDFADCRRFLESCDAKVYTGNPVAFRALANLGADLHPRALISSAMTLLPGLQTELESRFNCPAIDLYSMNESGPIALATGKGHEILPHDLYVEILDPEGRPCAPVERGEVTLTGGRNPFLPLLRYRTGDWAAMDFTGPVPALIGLEGRPPVMFRDAGGAPINNVDVTWALRDLRLTQYTLHQASDGALTVRLPPGAPEDAVREALLNLFGQAQALCVEPLAPSATPGGKVIQYTREP